MYSQDRSISRSGANTKETVLIPAAVRTRGVKIVHPDTPDDLRLEAQPLYLSGMTIQGEDPRRHLSGHHGEHRLRLGRRDGRAPLEDDVGMPIRGENGDRQPQHQHELGDPVDAGHRSGGGRALRLRLDQPRQDRQLADRAALRGRARSRDRGVSSTRRSSLEGTTFDAGGGLPVQQFRQPGAQAAIGAGPGQRRGDHLLRHDRGDRQERARLGHRRRHGKVGARAPPGARRCAGAGGGIWMSGAGPAIQSDGSIWVVTGNGDFDGKVDFSESVVRLRYTPAAGSTKASLKVAGWWTPWTDDGRTGGKPEGEGRQPRGAGLPEEPAQGLELPDVLQASRGCRHRDDQRRLGRPGPGRERDRAARRRRGSAWCRARTGSSTPSSSTDPGETAPADLAPAAAPANYAGWRRRRSSIPTSMPA